MDYPRNPAAPKEHIPLRRPSPDNPYTPGFTVPGGKEGLSLEEYETEILNHSPLVNTCINKFKWHLLSFTIITGIGGRYFSKYTGFGKATTFLTTTTTSLLGLVVGSNLLPQLRCFPEELNAYHQTMDLMLYGPYLRDKGVQKQIWQPKEMEMDPAKYAAKNLDPPSKL
jgi:hypothetical protein